ncbi:MAG TPA: hypothetical protein VFZ47_13095, partial [Chitinophagaceae bacterium]
EFQKEWGKDKKEVTRLVMGLSAADSLKFWPLYDAYEIERQKLGKDRILILDDYLTNYQALTNAKADDIINKIFKNEQALTQLQQQTYGKLKTALNPMVAAKFMHIERYIQTTIQSGLLEKLPVIGDLGKMKQM